MTPFRSNPNLLRELGSLVRIVARDAPASLVLADALQVHEWPIQSRQTEPIPAGDYAQIDPALAVAQPSPTEPVTPPHPSLSYAGYTPQQRYWLLEWLHDPTASAPPAFQQLYLAHLETNLFENPKAAQAAHRALLELHAAPGWPQSAALQRAILLGFWLRQDGPGLLDWIIHTQMHEELLGIGLGMAALLQVPMNVELFATLLIRWTDAPIEHESDILALRLSSLETNLGEEPLAHALAQLPEEAKAYRPWRCVHRDLRIALPQPDLRPVLEPILADVAVVVGTERAPVITASADETDETAEQDWNLVLEFGQSRSDYFDFALHRARQRPGYMQIMDEDRNLIYRVVFTKREIRHFWQLWEYVQNWSATHVYVNGKELEKWKIWPYSQYMR